MRLMAGRPISVDGAAAWVGALALGLAALQPAGNSDTFGHIAAGREIAQIGYVPSLDHFSLWFDEPQPWRNHNWLSGLVLFAVHAALGPDGLVLLSVALAAASAALFVLCARRGPSGARATCAILLIASIPAVRLRLSARPHMVSLLFEAILLFALCELSARPSARPRIAVLIGLSLLQVCWLNAHGSSVFGVAMTLGYLVTHFRVPAARREFGILLVLQALASCVSPWGPLLLLETFKHVADPAVGATISEWAPFDASHPPWYLGGLTVEGLLLAVAMRPLLRIGPPGIALFGLAAASWVMGLRSSRFILDALMLGAPALGLGLSALPLPARARRGLAIGSGVLAVLVAPIASARLPPFLPIGLGLDTSIIPYVSGRWLAQYHPRARIAGAIQDAWYMSFAVPESRVLVDGRLAIFGPAAVRELRIAFADRAAFRRLLDAHRIDAVVVKHALLAHRKAVIELQNARDFRLVALEDGHALYVRSWVAPEARAFVHLQPGYGPQAPGPGASDELARIAHEPASRGYYAYHAALDSLAPMLRNGGLDGLGTIADGPRDPRLSRALSLLRVASERVPQVDVAHVFHALVAAHACRLPEARAALELARASGESRQTLLIGQEIALRSGDSSSVRAFLDGVAKLQPGRADGWVEALKQALNDPQGCR
jgi:hypothetical protein